MTNLRDTTSLDGAREELRIAWLNRNAIARHIQDAKEDLAITDKAVAHYRAEVERQEALQAKPKGREAHVVIAVSDEFFASMDGQDLASHLLHGAFKRFKALAPDATTIDIDEHPTKLTPEELAEFYPLSDYAGITGYRWKASIS